MRSASLIILAVMISLSGCSTSKQPLSGLQQSAAVPNYISENPSCALVVGGAGSYFSDPKIGSVWYEVNRQITEYVHEILTKEGYRVVKFIEPPNASASAVKASVGEALAKNRCNTFIQISHEVDEDNNGRYFQFNAAILHIEQNGSRPANEAGTHVVIAGDYNRAYRYPRTPAEFDRFHTGTFANTAYEDLKNSGKLTRIVRGS